MRAQPWCGGSCCSCMQHDYSTLSSAVSGRWYKVWRAHPCCGGSCCAKHACSALVRRGSCLLMHAAWRSAVEDWHFRFMTSSTKTHKATGMHDYSTLSTAVGGCWYKVRRAHPCCGSSCCSCMQHSAALRGRVQHLLTSEWIRQMHKPALTFEALAW